MAHPARTARPGGALPLVLVACAGLVSATACAEPLVFPDWTIPVPEGTPVVEYPAATAAEREGNRIELVEDLVIRPREGTDAYSFYQLRGVAVGADGRIHVLDGGNQRVQVFDAAGEYLHTVGGPGQGPGEFMTRGGFTQLDMVVADGRVMVHDGMQSRISTFDAEGNHLGDASLGSTRFTDVLTVLDDGSLLAESRIRDDRREEVEDASRSAVGRFSAAGERIETWIDLPRPGNFQIGRLGLARPTGSPQFVATVEGRLYATASDEYQVLSFRADGATRWALRVAHERRPYTEADRDALLERMRGDFPDLDASGTEWPTRIGSIGRLLVDGHGHLWVTEFVLPYTDAPEEVAVDVYLPEGDRLFTGTMPNLRWTDAAGDHVYGVRVNPESGEQEPVRYRLEEPFR